MTLASMAAAMEHPADRRKRLFSFLAFAGRYGHADMATCRAMTTRDLVLFCAEVGTLLEEENPQSGD